VIEEVSVAGQRRQEEEGEVDGEGEGDAQQRALWNRLRRFSKITRQIGSGHDSSHLVDKSRISLRMDNIREKSIFVANYYSFFIFNHIKMFGKPGLNFMKLDLNKHLKVL
jgi:hypothetical protein